QKALCVIEFKLPYFDVFNEKELKEPARKKATRRKAKYFATSNFQKLIWYNTERVNSFRPEEEQIHDKYLLSQIENLDLIEEPKYRNSIISALESFLIDLYEVHTGKKPEPKQAIDELLIFRLQEKINRLSRYYKNIIEDKTHKDSEFSLKLQKWFIEQNWSFSWQEEDFLKAARQTAYLLINKILFYNLLQVKRPSQLDPLNIPDDLSKGGMLQRQLQSYFDYVLKEIDYETIYSADFIDQTAFPDNREVVEEIKELIRVLKHYDFSRLGYDIIGRIFERLIPAQERHNLGQYFTNPDIVDLILRFCLKHEEDKVFDPACGAGTFLVRAYQHKKLMNQRLSHQQNLNTLWGCDIAKFPAHLSTINLAINDLGVDENYPQIIRGDFFSLRLGGRKEFKKEARKRELVSLGEKKISIPYPKIVDCVVGNPPYTRQEEIPSISGDEGYKKRLISNALYDGDKKIANISKRAGIHAYFFIHGTKFLQKGGRFGFIVSNSWLDVDYGKGLQEFFLRNYKIIAIVESKVERWFSDADINTCIIVLEKCAGDRNKKERDENIVRFVYLFKPLRYFIPPAQDMWEKQVNRLKEIDKLKRTIL
ncbi:MAG: SAM-dependent DNA methyltransferase, partial [Candidatus Aminicenantes bacterium]